MPRYVILEHDWPKKHWDFMLEAGNVLQTWRLSWPPESGVSIPAEKSLDHRLIYLDYEGPISGNRGAVIRWDQGSYETLIDEEKRRVILVRGKRLKGNVELANHPESGWQFLFSLTDEERTAN
jgi:DNA polymerase Ligase (LigD)